MNLSIHNWDVARTPRPLPGAFDLNWFNWSTKTRFYQKKKTFSLKPPRHVISGPTCLSTFVQQRLHQQAFLGRRNQERFPIYTKYTVYYFPRFHNSLRLINFQNFTHFVYKNILILVDLRHYLGDFNERSRQKPALVLLQCKFFHYSCIQQSRFTFCCLWCTFHSKSGSTSSSFNIDCWNLKFLLILLILEQ